MRPIQLSVEGLTCFRERQDIDFRGLDLFAISGPTGAGKSTLLDAILFALYGEVPRVEKQELKEMISTARDRVSVRFDFGVGEHQYRIARALRRRGAASVRLDQHDGTGFNQADCRPGAHGIAGGDSPARARHGCVHPSGDSSAGRVREVPEGKTA